MFSTTHPALASGDFGPGFFHVLVNTLGGLSGAALILAVIGAVIGWAAACMIDRLPAPIGIILGIIGTFLVLSIL
jgi:hypothetical protein